jgi:lactate 2-monooxygenase
LTPERLSDQNDDIPFSFEKLEEEAHSVLGDARFAFVHGGSGAEETLRANREAYYFWRLKPRVLRDVSNVDTSIRICGDKIQAPFLIAPMGGLNILHPEGELACARAASRCGIIFVQSTASSLTMEEVAKVSGDGLRWFQLYPSSDRDINLSLVHRAESVGYSALLITVDSPVRGWSERGIDDSALKIFGPSYFSANWTSDPIFSAKVRGSKTGELSTSDDLDKSLRDRRALTWEDIKFIKKNTKLPVLVKGITHVDDAKLAGENGLDGIIVSNHGGRQLDGGVATIDALSSIYREVGGSMLVLVDGGARRGVDVIKAIALGASAVLIGRLFAYALALGGADGVVQAIEHLKGQIRTNMSLCGCQSVDLLNRTLIERAIL